MIMKKIIYPLVLSALMMTTSCDDFFVPDTDDTLLEKDYIGNYAELYTGFMGVATGVQAVVDQAIFLEGLRGNLLEPTEYAPRELWDIYNYADVSSNTIANPRGFYDIILNANDFLEKVFIYKEKNPTVLQEKDYNGLIGATIRYKAWAYLMLAKIYGEAVYLDNTLKEKEDLSVYPVLKFDELIDKCINLIEVGVNDITATGEMGEIRWSENLFPMQGDSPENLEWNRICPPADCLLAELYLYKVKSSNAADLNATYYQKVWNHCVKIIREGGEEASFQLNLNKYDGSWIHISSATAYNRMEHIAVAFYDYGKKQTNRLIEYYSDQAPNKYYLRPAASAVNYWVASGTNDNKNRGVNKSYKEGASGYVFCKNINAHTTSDLIYRNDVFISYYRAGDIHLWLSEACAGLGRYKEALTFLNGGIGSYYNKNEGRFDEPFTLYPISLYEAPGKASLKSCMGVRGRVSAPAVGEYLLTGDGELTVAPEVAKHTIDSLLVEESFLESAGEARSYYAMLRMAMRYGDEERANWAEAVARKYPDGGAAIRAKLESDINNWFIKYDLKLKD